MRIVVRPRHGDWFILAGAATIVAWEKLVHDDADLISSRVGVYRKTLPVVVDAAIVMTALHLMERLDPRIDLYHQLVRYFRSATPPP